MKIKVIKEYDKITAGPVRMGDLSFHPLPKDCINVLDDDFTILEGEEISEGARVIWEARGYNFFRLTKSVVKAGDINLDALAVDKFE